MVDVTKESYRHLHEALTEIEMDSGTHLIGTVYPGTPIDLETFRIDDDLVPGTDEHYALLNELHWIDTALSMLKVSVNFEEYETFLIGDQDEALSLVESYRSSILYLDKAHQFLDDYFNRKMEE